MNKLKFRDVTVSVIESPSKVGLTPSPQFFEDIPASQDPLPPAVLLGTPKADSFPISKEELIEKAKSVFKAGTGLERPDDLADDFRFEFPIISLPKKEYLAAVSSFRLKEAFPDINPHAYDFRVDPFEPNRVWFTSRVTATHKGALKFGDMKFDPTNKLVFGAPECQSYTFNAEGKVTSFTGGYIMDRRVGNTKGLGAVFGIIAAIGGPVLQPGSPILTFLQLQGAVTAFLKPILGSK
ncbi:hypothetical protein CEUSTIGMA_g11680.t1 [Chlamydomonas eustigma]|uniref:Uncharacterized protein n=1 Tax=Chlamydomonas eustigma TaxID=1157962 RepID=A0A250XMF5_9CHLO|nr:hypothetical protein CEUSTIGMA_g11680.t1 [Chlamydomonas eustigma]|eukprot:GAX84257.1 hypothetical protein CEUSTIGMA_g11680.t1 [Chlamydomonas eustigma]